MTKKALSVLSLLLCLSLLLTTFGTAQAKSAVASSLPQPTITPLTGNPTYTTTLLPIKDMPGVTALDSGKFVPTGYESGEKQFEGSGLRISNFSGGSATLCFPIAGTKSGWGGKVAIWDGSKWELLATTISPAGDEIPYSWACTAIYGSGTFAMIKWIADASLLSKSKTDCNYGIVMLWPMSDAEDHGDYMIGTITAFYIFTMDPAVDLSGQTVSITFKTQPTGMFSISAPLTGTLTPAMAGVFGTVLATPVDFIEYYDFTSLTIHFNFGTCTEDFVLSGT